MCSIGMGVCKVLLTHVTCGRAIAASMAHLDSRVLPNLRTREAIQGYLRGLAQQLGVKEADEWLARELDRRDQLSHFRASFNVPTMADLLEEEERDAGVDPQQDCIYLCGNSCGLQPKGASDMVAVAMDAWAKRGVRGHVTGKCPWYPIEDTVSGESAKVVGAKVEEVTIMNTLSVNIHLGLVPFYQPTKQRYKILMEEQPFPSDLYAVQSQVRWHGYDPDSAIIFAKIKEGERVWHDEDIVRQIEEEGDSIALVYLSGVHFATGHFFDMKTITEAGHRKGCYVGWDLAHAAGNVELSLHDWGVDVACWCNYKYLNSGPGAIAGFFVHEKHAHSPELPRFLGWWAHNRETRLKMDNVLDLQSGAKGFQLSNPPVLECMTLMSSLNVFQQTSMEEVTRKSRLLTGYLELLLEEGLGKTAAEAAGSSSYVEVVTSSNPARRGNQLSIRFVNCSLSAIRDYISRRGAVVDLRPPDVMRVAPAPLYNSFSDVLRFYQVVKQAMDHV